MLPYSTCLLLMLWAIYSPDVSMPPFRFWMFALCPALRMFSCEFPLRFYCCPTCMNFWPVFDLVPMLIFSLIDICFYTCLSVPGLAPLLAVPAGALRWLGFLPYCWFYLCCYIKFIFLFFWFVVTLNALLSIPTLLEELLFNVWLFFLLFKVYLSS